MSRPQGASVFPNRPRKKLEARSPFALASRLPTTTRLLLLFFHQRRFLLFLISNRRQETRKQGGSLRRRRGKNGKKKGGSMFFYIIVLIRFNYDYFVLQTRGQDLITIRFYHGNV